MRARSPQARSFTDQRPGSPGVCVGVWSFFASTMGASASTSYSLDDVKVKYEQLEGTLGPVELPEPFSAAPEAIPLVKACEAVGTAGPLPRPVGAVGTFLRIVTVNDVYKLDNYPNVATAIAVEKFAAEQLGGVVKATINGDTKKLNGINQLINMMS